MQENLSLSPQYSSSILACNPRISLATQPTQNNELRDLVSKSKVEINTGHPISYPAYVYTQKHTQRVFVGI